MWISLLVATVMVTHVLSQCPSGYEYYTEDETCLKAVISRQSFDNARKSCQSEGGDLAQVRDTRKSHFILKFAPECYWMGLHDPDHNGKWTFVDGEPLSCYSPWKSGKPNKDGGKEFCVRVGSEGKWDFSPCHTLRNYVCEMKACPHGYKRYSGDNSCIKAHQDGKSFNVARKMCSKEGADLVKVQDADKASFIASILPRAYWVGVHDPNHNQKWSYLDRTPLGNYRPWNRGEPNNSGGIEFCVMVYQTSSPWAGKWNDCRCSAHLFPVCEISSRGPTAFPV